MRALIWFRADLRVADNTALHAGCAEATRGVIAIFLICPDQWRAHDWAAVKVDFMLRNLDELSARLARLNIPLLVRKAVRFADAPETLLDVALKHDCDAVFFNREYEVNERERDARVTATFERAGLGVRAHTDQVVLPPGSIRTQKGDFYSVFTPYKRVWLRRVQDSGPRAPLRQPKRLPSSITQPDDVPEQVEGFAATNAKPDVWPAGERVAKRRLTIFVRDRIDEYDDTRDLPALTGTSQLSPYLAVGTLSPRQCLAAAMEANDGRLDGSTGAATWISELIWREFYRHVLVGFPRVSKHRPFRPETDRIRWRQADADFDAWCRGVTGVPIIDAAMRQLLDIGWMHNRLRMITAMFLTKHLLVDWRRGERFFMQHLIDGDLASNNGGWQWSASTGTDAAPYFRIFNPFRQSKRFDPDGAFIRHHLPELAGVEPAALHDPARCRGADGDAYPSLIVDLDDARDRAIEAFGRVLKAGSGG